MRCLRPALTIAFLIILTTYSGFSFQTSSRQSRKTGIPAGIIPPSLKESLDARLKEFVQAQADGRWDEVGQLLGPYRLQGREKMLFTPSHKECFVSQIRSSPIVEFTRERISFSTEILSKPLGKRWWYVEGTAEFLRPGGRIKNPIYLVAYLDQGEWYFTPPDREDELIKAKMAEEKIPTDLSKELLIELDPNCPLEIVDVQVETDPKLPLFRKFSFALRNKTNKKVTAYQYRLGTPGNPCSSMLSGPHIEIAPGATSDRQTDVVYSPWGTYCTGKYQHTFTISEVSFQKNNQWWDPRFRPGHRSRNCLF